MGRRAMLAVAAACLLLVSACGGGSGGDGNGKTEITFSYLWTGAEGEAMEKIIEDFNESQDEIVVKGVSSPDQQKQLTAMSSTNGGFDISDNYDYNVGSWGAKGVVEPLDEYIERDDYELDEFLPAAMENMQYDGKIYALPIAMHNYQLLYNKELLAAAGYPEPPKTTEEWADAIAKTTKVADDGSIEQLGFGGTSPETIDPRLQVMAYAFGGAWFDGDAPAPESPGNAEAIQFYIDNVTDKYGVSNVRRFSSGHGEYASAQNAFFSGRVAMIIDGEWISQFAKQFAPDFEWGVAPIPHPADQTDLEGSTYGHSSTMFIPTNSKHKDEAWEFMKFVLSKESMRDFTAALANLPTRSSLIDDPAYDELPNFDGWASQLENENLQYTPPAEYVNEYNTDLATALEAAAAGDKSPQDALASVADNADGYGG